MPEKRKRRIDTDIYAETDKKRESTRKRMALMSQDKFRKKFNIKNKQVLNRPEHFKTNWYQYIKNRINIVREMQDRGATLGKIAASIEVSVPTLSRVLRRLKEEDNA